MSQVAAQLNEGFAAVIDYTATADGYIEDVRILSAKTGEDLTDGFSYSSTAWDQAWSAAQRHLLAQPVSSAARRAAANDMAAMCSGTPFAYGVAS